MSENDYTFSFGDGDDDIKPQSKTWKGEEGRTSRLSVISWPGLEDGKPDLDGKPVFKGAKVSYLTGVGTFINKGGPEFMQLVNGEVPKPKVGLLVVVWPTNNDGVPLAGSDILNAKVMPWVIPEGKYAQLRLMHREFPLGSHDFTATCSDTQFQKMTFASCKDSLLRKLMEKADTDKNVKALVDKLVKNARDEFPGLMSKVAKDLTVEQIRVKLAEAGGAPQMSSSGASPSSETMADVDSIIGGMLGGGDDD